MLNMKREKIDYEKVEKYIHSSGNYNFIDIYKLSKLLQTTDAAKKTVERWINIHLKPLNLSMYEYSKDAYVDLLLSVGIPSKFLEKKTKGKKKSGELKSIRYDSESIQESIQYLEKESEYRPLSFGESNVLEYLYLEQTLRKLNSIKSSVLQKFNRNSIYEVSVKGWEDMKLCAIDNIYIIQSTSRYYARQENIVSMNKNILKCFTVEEGKVFLSMDMGQADLVIAYSLFFLGYYSDLDESMYYEKKDRYKVIYEYIHRHFELEPDMEEFTKNRGNIKKNILSAMYGAGAQTLNSNYKNVEFNKRLQEFFNYHPGFVNLKEKITNLYEMNNIFVVEDYFGFKIEISNRDEYGGRESYEKTLDYVISRVVQTTTSSVLYSWLIKVKEELENRGLSDDDAYLSMMRHDETVFSLSMKGIKNLDVFKNYSEIRLGDWLPLYLDMDFYIHYSCNDEEETPQYMEILENIRELAKPYIENSIIDEYDGSVAEKFSGIPEALEVKAITLGSHSEILDEIISIIGDKISQDISISEEEFILYRDVESLFLSDDEAEEYLRKLQYISGNITTKEYFKYYNKYIINGSLFNYEELEKYTIDNNIEYMFVDCVLGSFSKIIANQALASSNSLNKFNVLSEFESLGVEI